MFGHRVNRATLFALCAIGVAGSGSEGGGAAPVDFNRDIRPILSDACFQCHGPDNGQRKGELRLDVRSDVMRDRGGYAAVVPGQPDESEVVRRIESQEDGERMPPAGGHRSLTATESQVIRRWIAEGAPWSEHWAFQVAQAPRIPNVADPTWPTNPVDYFVLSQLDAHQISPSPMANRAALIRRVTLDLTGLPPTLAEIDAFLADQRPGAYERLVERLLASPRFGEHMAVHWLDAARYADTNGYQTDGPRIMWRWRDWVMDALNHNMPFDRFTIEQLAGDLLPNASLQQKIATGFHRNHRGNAEGGIVPAEFAVEYVVDRVDTTGTVWLGLTLGCVRCHDHKYDPLTQRDYYGLYAFFNNVPEEGRALKEGNSPPYIQAPTTLQQMQLHKLRAQAVQSERKLVGLHDQIDRSVHNWLAQVDPGTLTDWTVERGLVAHFPMESLATPSPSDQHPDPTQAASQPAGAQVVDGVFGSAVEFSGQGYLTLGDVARFGYFDRLTIGAWVYLPPAVPADSRTGGVVVSRMQDEPEGAGYAVSIRQQQIHVDLVRRWLDDAIRVQTTTRLETGRWHHVAVTYDGSRTAKGVQVYLNGVVQPLQVNLDWINQSFATVDPEPLRIGGGGGVEGLFLGRIDDVRFYDRVVSPNEMTILATPVTIRKIVEQTASGRTPGGSAKVREYFLEHVAEPEVRATRRHAREHREAYDEFERALPTVMVMSESEKHRETFVLTRGQYDQPGEPVSAHVPTMLGPFPAEAPRNRWGLAQWLVAPEQPLTSRVIVNRYWQLLFGIGLVKSSDDFGTQGAPPSHPELLDWLAVDFVKSGWDVKRLFRTIVTSSTYRQSSAVTAEQLDQDPENKWLGRGPRQRLSAQALRDQSLAASGLLVEQVGGPSVRPYQPPGLWKEIATDTEYLQSQGRDLYRRSVYTYWKRTVAPPNMTTFDAPTRESCVVRKPTTNTPLQALSLMNDTTFVECARVLATRALELDCDSDQDRLNWMFRTVTSRWPTDEEAKILQQGLDAHRVEYRGQPAVAQALLDNGESAGEPRHDPVEIAANTIIANMLLNLDESITNP